MQVELDGANNDALSREACAALARGWALTPMNGKKPTLPGWSQAPPADAETVLSWAQQGNLGVRTGKVSGIVVIDDDTVGCIASVELGLPPTPTVATGGGGRHHYFRSPEGGIRNSTSKLAEDVDVRGEGGVAVLPGSVHLETGAVYEWLPGLSPEEVAIAELPVHVLEMLRPKRKTNSSSKSGPSAPVVDNDRLRRYAEGALRNCVDQVAQAPEGTRNQELNRQAFLVGRFVGAGVLDRSHAEAQLADAAQYIGLTETEIASTIASGVEAGIADPHDLAELQTTVEAARVKPAIPDGTPAPEPDPKGRPTVLIEGGKLPEIVTEAERALRASSGDPIYQRGGMLVRLVRGSAISIRDGIHRRPGALSIVGVDPTYLGDRLTEAVLFLRYDMRRKGYCAADCPTSVANTLHARSGRWTLPELLGVVESPTLRPDGSLLEDPGYDSQTRLYFDPGGTEFLPIEPGPTIDQAHAGLEILLSLIDGFPFVSDADRSVALACFLTVVVRRSIRTAPLTAFSAPKMASGKSLLADVSAMIGTGRVAAAMSQGDSDTEDRKRMLALLLEGDQVACIDNVERPLGGPALCSALTQDVWKDRILGLSRVVTVPTAVTWMATGNNIQFTGDITTRVLVCSLDPRCERPEERKFGIDLRKYVPEHRGELVAAILTILRGYVVAGRPDMGLRPFGRFEEWSDLVRSALVWLGQEDPCATRQYVEQVDPVRQALRGVLQAWWSCFEDKAVAVSQVISAAHRDEEGHPGVLFGALWEIASGKSDAIDSRRLGNWIAKHVRRVENGLHFERAGERSGVSLWRVVHAS